MRSSARLRSAVFVSALVACSLPETARAQSEGFALERFDPSAAGDPFFGVQSPHVFADTRPSFIVLADYAHAPLVLRRRNGDEIGKLVSDQLFVHATAAISLLHRVLFHVDVPFVTLNSGGSPSIGGTTFASPSSAALGDVKLGARVRLIGDVRDPVQVAFATSVWLPTGSQSSYAGDGRARALPSVIVGGRLGDVIYTSTVGFALRPDRGVLDTPVQNEATFGAGVALLSLEDRLQIGPEVYGTTAVGKGRSAFSRSTTSGELLLGVKYRMGPWVVGGAAGPGLGVGLGTPDVRAVVSIGYAEWGDAPKKVESVTVPPKDRDGDGILDGDDACVDTPGVASSNPKKNGCPKDLDDDGIADQSDACPDVAGPKSDDPKKNGCPDKDGDGIVDRDDACPEVAGVADPDPKKNGCPPDKDGDGIVDASDACPDVPGVADPDPKRNGCPPDKDGDGILDANDACPDQPGPADPDPKKNGCPKVILTAKAIVITEQIHFEFNKAAIQPDSDALLQQIAKVLIDHPELKKLQIEGHTDNQGGGAYNMTLSQKRADAVKKWLVDHGVAADRLVAKGFGLTKPIADNKKPEGREKNRRVEFNILDPKPPKDEVKP